MPVTRVLHRAADLAELHHLAAHPAVDAIEAAVWVRNRQPLVHHDRPVGRFPVGISSWPIRRRPPPPKLDALLDAVEGRAGLLIDLRAWFGDPAPDLVRVLASTQRRDHIRVACDSWEVAGRVREWLPDVDVAYAIRSERQLIEYLSAHDRGLLRPTPVVVRHTLIHTPDEVDVIRRRAGRVAAGIVNDIDRALDLAEWGIDDLISNHIVVLNAI